MSKKKTLKKVVRKEVIRALLQRTQSIDMVASFGINDKEEVHYDDVKEELNIPYMSRQEVPLALDIFKPDVDEKKELPVIVTIHGGGLTAGTRKISRPFACYLAHKGYLVFSLGYRLAPKCNVCQQLDDICAGLNFVSELTLQYNVDYTRLFIAAESAGAFLAMYATAMSNSLKLQEAIGYKPTRLKFKSLGLLCGMIYTNKDNFQGNLLKEQIYGDKEDDENFLQYMNPENPEIINNIPPTYLVTSLGDFLNSESLQFSESLKKAGKPYHLHYYGDEKLAHAFPVMQINEPKSKESIDLMLTWFEKQADIARLRSKQEKKIEQLKLEQVLAMKDGSLDNQRIWQYIKQRSLCDPMRNYAPAIIDCTKTYTYGQMFEQWEKYACVFTALKMTDKNHSRVAIAGSISAEPLFAFYGLNITGAEVSMFSYPDFLPGGRWETMVKKEHITDLIITDIMVNKDLMDELEKKRSELGLRNIIFIHSRIGGPSCGPAELMFNEINYHILQENKHALFMDNLIEKYKDKPIYYSKKDCNQIAVITHTSGTTKGTRKPLPYTDKAINSVASGLPQGMRIKTGVNEDTRLKTILSFDFSSFFNVCGIANTNFASGNTIILTFFGGMHPKFYRAIKYYQADIAFTASFMFENIMKMSDLSDDEFSSLKLFAIGGSYLPIDKVKKYKEFLKKHGYSKDLYRSYGMSETGGCELTMPENCDEDILGYPIPEENFRIYNESDKKFYPANAHGMSGVMYIASNSLCCNKLDGKKLFDYTIIDGRNFICTNDMVRVNKNGSFTYAGRMDKYFVNNEGVRFEAGKAETYLTAHKYIDACAFVPVLDKRIHDTVPVLYVIPNKGYKKPEYMKEAIEDVFLRNKELKGSVLPTQVSIVNEIPHNINGKIDIYQITRSRLKGTAYNILPIKKNKKIVGIELKLADQLNTMFGGTLPEGMGKDSAINIFDLLNVTKFHRLEKPKAPFVNIFDFDIPLPDLPDGKAFAEFSKKNPEVMEKLMTLSIKLQKILFGSKDIKKDFEE